MDELFASIRDRMPPLWWALYTGSREAGFTDEQALILVQAFIIGSNVKSVFPTPFGKSNTQTD